MNVVLEINPDDYLMYNFLTLNNSNINKLTVIQ